MTNKNLGDLKMFSKAKQKSFMEMLKYEARQFCLNTALHGYRFIVLPRRVLLEKVIWSILVIVSLISAITLMCLAWFSFQSNPTFLVTDSTQYPIWNYPFPGVTICNLNKMVKPRVEELAANLSKDFDDLDVQEVAKELRLLFQLVNLKNLKAPSENYTRLQRVLEQRNLSPLEILKYLAPSCEETLQRCKWKGEEKRCESLFEMIPTTEGFCCAFNYFALKNHTFGGYLTHKAPQIPRRVSACGYQTGLEVLMFNVPEYYFLTQIPSVGHRILIHNSYHFPDSTVQTVLSEIKLVNLIDILPSITYSTDKLKNLNINQRNCLLPNERDLLNFDGYNHHNCMIECRMNLTREFCKCIPLIYYNPGGSYPETRLCNLRDVSCLLEYNSKISSSVPGFDFDNVPKDHVYGTEKDVCGCLPDCEYVTYLGEPSSGRLNRAYATNQLNLYGGLEIKNQSVTRVFFDDMVATRNRRDVTFTWHTLLAYYGGLLGLFVGFSFVSAIEVVYFFTIRLFTDIALQNKISSKDTGQKIKVQPMENLDPKKLMAKKEVGGIRHRTNSNPGYYD